MCFLLYKWKKINILSSRIFFYFGLILSFDVVFVFLKVINWFSMVPIMIFMYFEY
jgi:hypothetical protein